MALYKMEEDDM
ncbi:Protein of unknown function [Bacillus mycoides]|nr:Protein of unknown function [Bacillus mycoides]